MWTRAQRTWGSGQGDYRDTATDLAPAGDASEVEQRSTGIPFSMTVTTARLRAGMDRSDLFRDRFCVFFFCAWFTVFSKLSNPYLSPCCQLSGMFQWSIALHGGLTSGHSIGRDRETRRGSVDRWPTSLQAEGSDRCRNSDYHWMRCISCISACGHQTCLKNKHVVN